MIKREPQLELLLRGGDLIALAQLDYHELLERMRAVFRGRLPAHTQHDPADPGLALLDALAACLDVMGFYHDRILTESKLGSAQLIESVARLGAAVGYRPLPPIAATATQFFEAAQPGTVLAGTRVGGPGAVFATTSTIEIAPAFNGMGLSPVLTLQVGALRAVIRRLESTPERAARAALSEVARQQADAPASLPTDEFRRGMLAMLNSEHGLELCPIAGARQRGVAFTRALLRSYDESTTLARTTRVRHLRFSQPLDDSLVVFEVSELPILGLPDPAAPEHVKSTLEIFVFDEAPPSPEDWDPKAAWTEVADFSVSKVTDQHYRTFVDDRLTTYLVLRRKLGYRTLIEDARLALVYARYTPAIGRVIDPPSPPELALLDLDAVTMQLDRYYFATSLVRPKLEGVPHLHNEARWAVTKDDLGLQGGAQIAILGGASGATYVRTLLEVRERYLKWSAGPAKPRQSGRPANEHDPIDDLFDPAKGKIAPLAEVAAGQLYPLWEAYYKQAKKRDDVGEAAPAGGWPIPTPTWGSTLTTDQLGTTRRFLYLHKGSTFLLLEDGSHVKAGDYLLVGRRWKQPYRKIKPSNVEGPSDGKEWFDTHKPWLSAEVVQALEVHGGLVRIKDPVGQDYYQERLKDAPDPITEIVVVPRVASVYYGDVFVHPVTLTAERTFVKLDATARSRYIHVELDEEIDPVAFRNALGLQGIPREIDQIFFAVEGMISNPLPVDGPNGWSFALTLPARGLRTEQIASLWLGDRELPVTQLVATGTDLEITLSSVDDAIAVKANQTNLLLLAKQPPAPEAIEWTVESPSPGQGQFRVLSRAGWFLQPTDLAARETLLEGGGTLLLWDGGAQPRSFAFEWQSAIASLPLMLRLTDAPLPPERPVDPVALDAIALPGNRTFMVQDLTWTADWGLPAIFPNQASWTEHVGEGFIEGAGPLPRRFDINAGADDRLELRQVEITPGKQIDPLSGASALWALPDAAGAPVTAARVTAIWRFEIGESAADRLGQDWSGLLVVEGDNKILRSPKLEDEAPTHLTARLQGDVKTGFASPASAIHALLPVSVTPAPADFRQLWEWDGDLPFDPPLNPAGAVAFTFATSSTVFLADIWLHAPTPTPPTTPTLRLIPRASVPPAIIGTVNRIVESHSEKVKVTSNKPGDPNDPKKKPRVIKFQLPSNGPDKTSAEAATSLVVTKSDQSIAIIQVNKKITVTGNPGQEVFTAEVDGDQTDTWSEIRLGLREGDPGDMTRRTALHSAETTWNHWAAGDGLELYFMSEEPDATAQISDLPGGSRSVAVHGTHRADGNWFVPEASSDSFPLNKIVYLSPYSATDIPVQGITHLQLDPPSGETDRFHFMGIRDAGSPWHQHRIDSILVEGDHWTVEVSAAAPGVFPDGIGTLTKARLAYDYVDLDEPVGSQGLRLHTVLSNADGTNEAVFHGQGFGDVKHAPSTPGAGKIRLEIDPNQVFSSDGHPRAASSTRVSLGYSWRGLETTTLSAGALTLELGPPAGDTIQLAAQDELLLVYAQSDPPTITPGTITAVTPGAYKLGFQHPPSSVRLHRLRAPLERLEVRASFQRPPATPEPQEPWLLTFTAPGEPVSDIAATLLFHGGAHEQDGQLTFMFTGTEMLDEISSGKPLRHYTNQQGQLHRGLYAGDLSGFAGSDNFLLSDGTKGRVEALLAAESAASFQVNRPPAAPHVLLCSTKKTLAPGTGYFARGTRERESRVAGVNALSQSIVFHSGDFIPVTGTLAERDDKIIRNALRVWLLDEEQNDLRLVTYEPRLSKIVELYDAGNSWDQIRLALAKEWKELETLPRDNPSLLLYSFNKNLGGAFTLNFLLIDSTLPERPIVGVYVEYTADRLSDEKLNDIEGQIYEFETDLLRLEPSTQLVVLDKGELKAGDYLFLHIAQQEIIHWTQISSITGLVIDVTEALPFELDSDPPSDVKPFRTYALRGFAKPPRPMELDKGYYAQAKDAELAGEPPARPEDLRPLVLADRLALRPVADQELLAAIVPGDNLLIWDEAHREAWHRHRIDPGSDDPSPDAPPWRDWPDYQVEAVVKQVDAATGLIVLAEPLPERFAVTFSLVDHPDESRKANPGVEPPPPWLTLEPDPLTLRVLPHYRAPFQGERRLLTLGSGDRRRRFARFTGTFGQEVGLGTLPLAGEGLHASNIEVLARDPRSGDWTRWTELATIDAAEKKDRAFTLGIDASRIGIEIEPAPPVPFSVSFGDGEKHGQLLPNGDRNVFARTTAIGGQRKHAAAHRPLLILDAKPGQPLPLELPPEVNAARENLRLVIETGAPEAWSPAGRRPTWQPAMEIEAPYLGESRRWREISREEACQGWDGFYVRGLRPGVVEVCFFAPRPLEEDRDNTRAWEVPDARQWVLDADFYAELARQDLTRLPGAKQLQLLETDGLAPGSLLALSQVEGGPTEIVHVDAVDPDTWSATLTEPLTRTYAIGASSLRGNLAPVIQGDTERVVLGSGDGSTLGLRLAVYSRAPLLHVLLGRTDPEPAITVLVDNAAWTRVPQLDDDDVGPRDRVYRVDVEADGRVFVAFGDGVHGAVPGPGTNNIVARLRTGDGEKGNVPAGALNKLVDGNLAVKRTWNITDATGGRPGDTPDQAREALLGRSVELDRIVSLEDVSRVALEVGEVRHARVDPTAPPEILRLVVALVGRRGLTQTIRDAISDRITQLMPATAGLTLDVQEARQVPVHLAVRITAGEPGAVLAALQRAFSSGAGGFFADQRHPIAAPLRLGDVYEAIFAVPGVAAARVTWMSTDKPPASPREPAPDTVDPGPDGVIRCDHDLRTDPEGDRGTITFFATGSGGAS